MSRDDFIRINRYAVIPKSELDFRFSRSGGPGGQHANRKATQVELLFDVSHSSGLSQRQRQQVMKTLGNRIDSEGILHLTASGSRSQHRNREEVVKRFQSLMQHALRKRKRRKPTKPSRRANERRLEEKRQQSRKKELRKPPKWPR
jgi:ribosome-associated protein